MSESIGVIMCAYTDKRWDDVLAAYHSLVRQSVPADEIVLVVDHNPALLARLQRELSAAVVVANSHARGLSGARNTGVAATSSDLVLFLDDDATADEKWIEHMSAPFVDDAVVGVGGWAVPAWDAPGRPGWFPESFLWVVGSSYEGQPTTPTEIRNPLGCAMAFRRTALKSTNGFSDGIGRVGTHPLGCEETELSVRITRAVEGSRIVGEPAAVVTHRVTQARMTSRYFLRRCYWEGVSKAVVSSLVGAGAALSSEKVYTTRVLPRAFLRGLGGLFRGDLDGPRQSTAIAAGLVVTALGYGRGRMSVRSGSVSAKTTLVPALPSGVDVARVPSQRRGDAIAGPVDVGRYAILDNPIPAPSTERQHQDL